jgi:hypothetical protein
MTVKPVLPIELSEIFGGVPLSVVFADGEALALVRDGETDQITLEPPFHVSDEDVYLVLPADIGLELVDIFADGDAELLADSMREGVLVLGSIEREGKGRVFLAIEESIVVKDLLDRDLPYAAEVPVGADADPIEELNSLPEAQITMASQLVDDDGLENMLRREAHIGVSWRVPPNEPTMAGVDPTYAWSKRRSDGSVGIEAVLFTEYEELVMLLRPALLTPAAP